jgi:hypothetical protein
MKRCSAVPSLLIATCLLAGASSAQAVAADGGHGGQPKTRVFEVCKRDCRYRTIQKAVDAAGNFKLKRRNADRKAIVAVRPGKYVEGVVLNGTLKRKDYDGLTIEGTKKSRRKTILEGRGAKGELGPAANGVEANNVDGLVLKNLWARHFPANGFFIYGSTRPCDDYTMSNLLASDNRGYGLFVKKCFGGRMIDSVAFHHGDSAFYVGETPCDSRSWTNHGVVPPPKPCQRKPRWTVLKDLKAYENVLGYSGTNAKYVRILDSAFYNNGAGIVPNSLDSESFEPTGWNLIEHNDVFWNNYNYFLPGASFHTVSDGLANLGGSVVNFPTGVGIVLFGAANTVVRQNNVFGNYKWGVASLSAPGEFLVADVGDDAKSINNQVVENSMGRGGADPNGEFDFWNDNTGGGNCWGGNTPGATFAPGNGQVPLAQIYPGCPQAEVLTDQVKSVNFSAGLQLNQANLKDPTTALGYTSAAPPQNQQCSWVRRVAVHPPFQKYKPVEVTPLPGELSCP